MRIIMLAGLFVIGGLQLVIVNAEENFPNCTYSPTPEGEKGVLKLRIPNKAKLENVTYMYVKRKKYPDNDVAYCRLTLPITCDVESGFFDSAKIEDNILTLVTSKVTRDLADLYLLIAGHLRLGCHFFTEDSGSAEKVDDTTVYIVGLLSCVFGAITIVLLLLLLLLWRKYKERVSIHKEEDTREPGTQMTFCVFIRDEGCQVIISLVRDSCNTIQQCIGMPEPTQAIDNTTSDEQMSMLVQNKFCSSDVRNEDGDAIETNSAVLPMATRGTFSENPMAATSTNEKGVLAGAKEAHGPDCNPTLSTMANDSKTEFEPASPKETFLHHQAPIPYGVQSPLGEHPPIQKAELGSAHSNLRSPRSPKSPSKEQDKSGIQSTFSFTNERV